MFVLKTALCRIAVPLANFNTGGLTRRQENTFGGGARRDGRHGVGGGGGGHGGLGGLGEHGGHGGSAKDEFEFSSWPTPSSHCSQSMAAAAKEKVSTRSFSQNLLMDCFPGEILQATTNTWNTSLRTCYQVNIR